MADITAKAMPIRGHAVYIKKAAVSIAEPAVVSPRMTGAHKDAAAVTITFKMDSWSDVFTDALCEPQATKAR